MSCSGVMHWWAQRVTALILLPVPFLLMILLAAPSFTEGMDMMLRGYGGAATVAFLIPITYHGVLGVQVVLEDYVSSEFLRSVLITLVKLFSVVTAASVACVVLLHSFGKV